MRLESMLSPAELAQFQMVINEAAAAGGQAVRWHSATSNVLVVGICQGGELLTWFATPAHNEEEAVIAERIILAGITLGSAALGQLQAGVADVAAAALSKAARH